MEYLKLFTQHSDYEEFINGGGGGRFTQCILLRKGK